MPRVSLKAKTKRAAPPSILDMLLMLHRLDSPIEVEIRPTREEAAAALRLGLDAWQTDPEAQHMVSSIAWWCSRLGVEIPAWVIAAGGRAPAPVPAEAGDDVYHGDPLGKRLYERRKAKGEQEP